MNILFVFFAIKYFMDFLYIYCILSVICFLVAIFFLFHNSDEPVYKLNWLLIIILLPIFGTFSFFYLKKTKQKKVNIWNKNFSEKIELKNQKIPYQNDINNYIFNKTQFCSYKNYESEYLESGEKFFKKLFNDLKHAKKYIFLEFFIFKEGEIFNKLLSLLKEKTNNGIEVRILYDDFGCFKRIKKNTLKELKKSGIFIKPFNKIGLSINLFMNYRNHRKIAIIDGKIAYTGGVNVSDEYANVISKFGYWKDGGIRIYGEAVYSFLIMFLNHWNFKEVGLKIIEKYKHDFIEKDNKKTESYLQPFGINPVFNNQAARDIYIKIISSAKKQIDITTPYLIFDNFIYNGIKIAIESGVKVNLYIPGIPDKKFIYYLTLLNVSELVKLGVNVYVYKKGFLHSKILLCDCNVCIIGTINLDFRSLYLHFENGVVLYNDKNVIAKINKDLYMIKESSILASQSIFKELSWYKKISAKILKLFEQLL